MTLIYASAALMAEALLLVPFFGWGIHTLRLRYRYHEDMSLYLEGATLAGLVVWYVFQFRLLNLWLSDAPVLYFFSALGLIVAGAALYGSMLASLIAQLAVDLVMPRDRDLGNEPRFGPAEALERAGDYEGAAEEYMVIARMFPKDSATAIRLADNLMKLDRPEDAAFWFEHGVSLLDAPDKSLRVVNRLADLYARRLEKPEEAKRILHAYLRKFPDAAYADSVRDRLRRIEENHSGLTA